jgi:hypothetical protein
MDKSEYFVAAILALTASFAAACAMQPRRFALDGVVLQVSDAVAAEHRHIARPRSRHSGFSMQCELGSRVLSIDYSSTMEE